MFQFRQLLLLLLFSVTLVVTAYYARSHHLSSRVKGGEEAAGQQQRDNFSHFSGFNYYTLNQRGAPDLWLSALEVDVDHTRGYFELVRPDGINYGDTKRGPVRHRGERGTLNQKSNFLELYGRVKLSTSESVLYSSYGNYSMLEDKFFANGRVRTRTISPKSGDKILVNSDQVTMWPGKELSNFKGKVVGKIKRKRVYQPSMDFWADQIEVDLSKSLILLDSKVVIKRGTVKAYARRGEVYLDNYNKKLKYYYLYDDVKVVEQVTLDNGKTKQRRAYGERLDGVVSEEKIILTGYPKVFQEGDVIKGNKIVLRENSSVVEVDDATSKLFLKQ
ncbi:MAG: LPS export ABC transporter periplasmic protein LptC [Bdellovibrionales bacterium]|jgi:lipopolysaccharide transport protein LptA|nr:LPS export ABC transporter periplasmic protein LptC [Bdellovibrionales bacterium]MBT3525447.1 LPS export ABC transporter periplasmic protein LptC [Bdellovibrionales bacterium]MBT7668097.1 LPS export ABC transporter periplasmic protein LptC [Bdellovibrionales bacterium]MBT7766887.1 LPS export ABC transporter periplasmic protein LptC [Bdellovibrionales bacterium]